MDNKKAIEGLQIDLDTIPDQYTRIIIRQLLNIIETQATEIKKLRDENQDLRNENNQLKGEQGKPNIRKQSTTGKNTSSEKERKNDNQNPRKKKKKKKKNLTVHKTERRELDKSELPKDSVFKGLHASIVQDIVITARNIQFDREIYYSPSLNKTFIAPLPEGYSGDFGPSLKALILDLHNSEEMTESSIHNFLTTHGIDISTASISRILTDKHDLFHQEKKDIISAGLQSTEYQQMDDTSARVKGKNYYMHILCNDYYTAYFTRKDKARLTIIDILSQDDMQFYFNESSYELMEKMNISNKMLASLKEKKPNSSMNRSDVNALLQDLLPVASKQHTNRQIILEASAIIGYQNRPDAIKILLTDDAPQFKQITALLGLCWVHDGRHYKKLSPVVPLHRAQLEKFLTKYWEFYHELLRYKENPSTESALTLDKEFELLFDTVTGYEDLDERIQKTRDKKASLLLVLQYPQLPLHNNTSELGARKQARYRDISFHTASEKGTEAKDTFMTIIQTAKKLGVNSYQYFRERITNTLKTPLLSEQILILTRKLDSG